MSLVPAVIIWFWKKNKKQDNWSELRLEIARMWDKEAVIVPIIIEAQGSIPSDSVCNLGISYNDGTLQNSISQGTANIIRNVLSIKQ